MFSSHKTINFIRLIIVWPIFLHIYTETTINHLTSNNPFIWPCSFMYCVFRGQRSVRYCTAEVCFAFNDPCFASDLNLKPLSILLWFCSPLLVLGLVWMQLLLTTDQNLIQTNLCVYLGRWSRMQLGWCDSVISSLFITRVQHGSLISLSGPRYSSEWFQNVVYLP